MCFYFSLFYFLFTPPPLGQGASNDDVRLTSLCLTSVCRVHRALPKSTTGRHRKTKIGTEVAHVTCDSYTTFKVQRSKVNFQGRGILWWPRTQLVQCVPIVQIYNKYILLILSESTAVPMTKTPTVSRESIKRITTTTVLRRSIPATDNVIKRQLKVPSSGLRGARLCPTGRR